MKTGDFHGLDYNKDFHCVEGSIPPDKYRVLLKLHYMIIPQDTPQFWIDWVRFINVKWTQLSRETMRMSADPKTPIETLVGTIVNVCRYIFNNIYTIGVYLLVIILIILAFVYMPSSITKKMFKIKK